MGVPMPRTRGSARVALAGPTALDLLLILDIAPTHDGPAEGGALFRSEPADPKRPQRTGGPGMTYPKILNAIRTDRKETWWRSLPS